MKESFSHLKDFIYLWIYTKRYKDIIISDNESKWSKKLSLLRSEEYKLSRSFLRKSLSNLFNIDPLNIPIIAKPNTSPELPREYGYVSLSHCNDAFLVGWSKKKIGIDIENNNRTLNSSKLVKRLFTENEKNNFYSKGFDNNKLILPFWTIKESAVKWDRSSIFSNLKNWEINLHKNKILNLQKNISLDFETLKYKKWVISSATQKTLLTRSNFLCVMD